MKLFDKTIVINHILYFTPEQRIGLVRNRISTALVGISIPVWFNQGKSTEPAKEVFCQYTVTNEPKDMMVAALPTGYRINLPQPKPLADESEENSAPDLNKLGNAEDGGSGWLIFKQFQNLKQEDGTVMHILHYVEMRDIEYYLDSIRMDSIEETLPSAYLPSLPIEQSQDLSVLPS